MNAVSRPVQYRNQLAREQGYLDSLGTVRSPHSACGTYAQGVTRRRVRALARTMARQQIRDLKRVS